MSEQVIQGKLKALRDRCRYMAEMAKPQTFGNPERIDVATAIVAQDLYTLFANEIDIILADCFVKLPTNLSGEHAPEAI
jgi:hypothetical protein